MHAGEVPREREPYAYSAPFSFGRTLAVLCVFVIVGYALFVRPKEKDAPKRKPSFAS